MHALSLPRLLSIRLPRWHWSKPPHPTRKQRQATIDLISASPHLLRDIGIYEGHCSRRGR